nr:hypothetical protein [Tanacetum cinerariifolium]
MRLIAHSDGLVCGRSMLRTEKEWSHSMHLAAMKINSDLEEINAFRKSGVIFCKYVKTMIDGIRDCQRDTDRVVHATIYKIHRGHGWCYVACNECSSKVDIVSAKGVTCVLVAFSFRCIVWLINKSGYAPLVVFDTNISKLCGNFIWEINDKHPGEDADGYYPKDDFLKEAQPFVEWGQKYEEKQQSFKARLTINRNSPREALYMDKLENLLDNFMLSLNTEINDGSIKEHVLTCIGRAELEGTWPINVDHLFVVVIPISQLMPLMMSPIWFGLCEHKADWILYVTPVPQIEYKLNNKEFKVDDYKPTINIPSNQLHHASINSNDNETLIDETCKMSFSMSHAGGNVNLCKTRILNFVKEAHSYPAGNMEILVPMSETKLILSERQSNGTVTMHYCEFDDYDHSAEEELFPIFPNTMEREGYTIEGGW